MTKLAKWIAVAILAPIIVGVAIHYLTPPPPPPPPPPAVTRFEGMVYSGNSAVANAMVQLNLNGLADASGPLHNVTDEHGSYRFDLTGLPDNASATLFVTANGFQNSAALSLASPLQSVIQRDFSLSPVPSPAPPAGHGAVIGAHVVPPANFHIPAYIAKGVAQSTKFQVAQKP